MYFFLSLYSRIYVDETEAFLSLRFCASPRVRLLLKNFVSVLVEKMMELAMAMADFRHSVFIARSFFKEARRC